MRTFLKSSIASSASVRSAATKKASPRVLITGGLGQVGTDLATVLRKKYGNDHVVVTDIRKPGEGVLSEGPYHYLDVLDARSIERLCVEHNIDWVVHNSAIMSVLGELQPHKAMDLNIDGTRNVLEVSRKHNLMVYIPSSMAVFGPDCGKVMTKDDTILNPSTIYGVTKLFMEQLGGYYHRKWGVDFRCIRYPGIISAPTLPGGGTTDYAIHMYHSALKNKPYTCPVNANEPLPMMYVDDCIDGTIQFMEAPRHELKRCVYNISGFSFSPDDLQKSIIKAGLPLEVRYEKGIAQDIAHSWPDSMEDINARRDWKWDPKYDLDGMTRKMLELIPKYHNL